MATAAPAIADRLTVTRADYGNAADAAAVVALLDAYARDPMGGGAPLAEDAKARLVDGLASHPGTYSTFAARPLVNIHDMVVLPGHRGHGIARAMFAAIEDQARAIGACKVTLEVLSGNARARAVYASLGYGDYTLDPEAGHALFWQKRLT